MKKLIFFCIFVCGIGLQITKEGVSLMSISKIHAQSEGDYNWENDRGVGGYWENPDLPDRPELPNDPIDQGDLPLLDVDDFDIPIPEFPDFDDDRGDQGDNGRDDHDRDDGRDDFDNGQDAYGDDHDRDDGREQDDGRGDPNLPDRGDPNDRKDDVLKDMVDYLSDKIKEKDKDDFKPFPPTNHDPLYEGWGRGKYDKGEIKVPDKFFGMPEGDRMATLYHEYIHHKLDDVYPVGRDKNGDIIKIPTDSPIEVSEEEREHYEKYCEEDSEPYKDLPNHESIVRDCVSYFTEGDYTYTPSNYHLQEILAREGELQGERDGWYNLSEDYRDSRYNEIEEFTYRYERAVDYEDKYGYNPDGTKK